MKKNAEFTVASDTTLLPFLLESFSGKSRNYVKGLLTRGQISVDGVKTTDYSRALKPGQRVTAQLIAPPPGYKMSIPVLYEDEDIIVINKPHGMLAIATDKERESTAYHIVRDYIASRTKSGRVFVVHRLDRETSGVMLLAKNEKTKLALQDNWDEAVLHRGYTAVVEGRVSEPSGTVKSWLRQTKTLLVYSAKREGDGKLAITNYRTLAATGEYSLLDISLATGRKNQIRVHMSDLGHPVAGDKKYGAKTDPLKRLALHASVLTIQYPSTGDPVTFEAKTPGGFAAAVN